MVRPQSALILLQRVLGVSDDSEIRKGLFPRMAARETDVARWMPVLGGDLEDEGVGEEGVEGGDDGVCGGDGEGA